MTDQTPNPRDPQADLITVQMAVTPAPTLSDNAIDAFARQEDAKREVVLFAEYWINRAVQAERRVEELELSLSELLEELEGEQ